MIGARHEYPCGCVRDGETPIVSCLQHQLLDMLRIPVVRIEAEPLRWQLGDDGQVHGPFAVDGTPR